MRRILIPFYKADLPAAVVAAAAALRGGADEVVALAADEDHPPLGTFADGVRVITASDIGIDEERVAITAASHGTSAAPRAIVGEAVEALDGGDDATVVLFPMARVVAPLDSLWEALESHAVVVVPTLLDPSHNEVPQRRMGLERRAPSSPTDILASPGIGAISSSVIGLRPSLGRAVLDRWPGRMGEVSHFDAVDLGHYEAWLDGLGVSADAHVVRDPGLGVGWFNLHERETATAADGSLTADGRPLSLIDLRGHDPRRPYILCPHVSVGFLSENPALIPEVRAHSLALADAGATVDHGHGVLADHLRLQGRWATLPNGDQMVIAMRNLYRAMVADGELTRSPYTPQGQAEMIEAFRKPGPRGKPAGVNRFVWSLWVERGELRDAYPQMEGADGPGLIGWAWAYGRRDELHPESVLPDMAERFAAGDVGFTDHALAPPESRMSAHRGGEIDGVNVAGFFSTQLGLGESVRQLVHALRIRDVDIVAVQGRLIPSGRGQTEFAYVAPDQAKHPVSVLVLNGDSIPAFAEDVGEDFFRDRYTIGFYWWEVDPYPADAWDPALKYVDELWVGTEFVGDIIRPHVDVPVTVVRVPVAEPPPVTVDRAHFGLPEDATLFGFVYDYESSGQRKNPLGLVEAYRKAFGPDDGCHLLLKSLGSIHRTEDHEEVLVAAAGREDITIIDRYLSAEEKDSLVGLCDCYVSPHRSEGFGYTLAEAMAYGKPVVCTGFGGVMDFATEENARLVDWVPSVTGPFAIPYPPDSRWADPDIDDLARQMRWVFEHPEEAAEMGRRAAEGIKQTHSYEASGASMEARLREIYREIDARNQSAPARQPGAPGETVSRRALDAALRVPAAGSGLQRARRMWWSVMDRAVATRTRPALESLREHTADVERAVTGTDRELDRLRQQLAGRTQVASEHELRLRAIERAILRVADGVEDANASIDDARGQVEQLGGGQQDLAGALTAHTELHAPVPYGVAESGMTVRDSPFGRALHARFEGEEHDGYGSFLQRFRGDWERVRGLAKPYGALLEGHGPVLDLGCGRGELLDVLAEHGVEARGIDQAPELVAAARERSLDVSEGDALEAVLAAEEGSLGAITALHVVEHLDASKLQQLLAASHRALRPGGLLVLETVNVYDMRGAAAFWLDPTHRQPLLPEALLALTGDADFAEGWVFAPDGEGDWDLDRSRMSRYTVVARRA